MDDGAQRQIAFSIFEGMDNEEMIKAVHRLIAVIDRRLQQQGLRLTLERIAPLAPGKRRIDEVWVFVSLDENGDEGVCGFMGPSGWMPMVAADAARLAVVYPLAQDLVDRFGAAVQLIRLSNRSVVDVLTKTPGQPN